MNRVWRLLAWVAFVGSAGPASAWDVPFMGGDPARVQAEAKRLASSTEDLTVLFEETVFRFDAEGRRTYRFRTVFVAMTDEGAEAWSEAVAYYSPWHQARPVFRARVITPDLKVHVLDASTLAEEPAVADGDRIYSDRRVLRGPLPGIAKGAVVEEEIEISDAEPFFEGGSTYRVLAYSGFPVLERRLLVVSPAAQPVRVLPRSGAPAPTSRIGSAGETEIAVTIDNARREFSSSSGTPPELAMRPHYLIASGRSWQDVATRYSRLIDSRIDGADVSVLVRGLRRGGPVEDAARDVLKNLKEIVRYSGIEFGQASILPWAPAKILERRYGDCKDQASLVVAALRSLGHSASVALLRTDWGREADPEGPGVGDFDHAIVVVQSPGRALWLDPTVDEPGTDMLPAADQGRLALIADASTTMLTRTPETKAVENRTVETRAFELSSYGTATVVETSEYFGGSVSQHPAFTPETKSEDLKSLREYAEREYLSKEVAVEAPPPASETGAKVFRMRVRKAKRGATETATAVVAVRPSTFVIPFADSLVGDASADAAGKAREVEYLFWEPFTYEWRYRVKPPRGFVTASLPAAGQRKLGTVTLTSEFKTAPDGTISGSFRIDSGPRRISAADFEGTRKALRALRDEEAIVISLKHEAETALQEGNLPLALAGFRSNLATDPDGHTRARYARALLAAGFGESAREQARRAVAEAPSDAETHAALGWVLQHDTFGRRFGAGAALDLAEAAHRKAAAADPERDDFQADLAILLEHTAGGKRYKDPKRLKEAIALYEPIKERLVVDNLGLALMWAGDYAAAEMELARSPATPSRNAWRVTVAAMSGGPDSAIAKATEVAPGLLARRPLLETSAQTLAGLRRWELASRLNIEAAKGSEQSAGLLDRAALQKRIRRHDASVRPLSDPIGLVQEFLRRSARRDANATELIDADSVVPLAPALVGEEVPETLADAGKRLGSLVRKLHPDPDVSLDLLLSLSEFYVEGSEASGFRVRLKAVDQPQAHTFIVVPRKSSLRLAYAGTTLLGVGLESLRRIDSGDLQGAGQWLDWAREAATVDARNEDPLQGPLIHALWGKDAARTPAQAKLAAASLLVAELPDRALSILEPALRAEPSPTLKRGVAVAYMTSKRFKEAQTLVDDLARQYPASLAGFIFRVTLATVMNDLPRAEALAQGWIKDRPADGWGLRMLASVAERRGDPVASTATYKQLIASEFATPMDYNNLAWESLFVKEATDTALEWSRRAVAMTNSSEPGFLNTLATLYAETGATRQALELVWKSMELEGADEPRPEDYFVMGRMAEAYQLADVARAAYAKVPQPRVLESRAISARALADRRLAAMTK